MKVPKVISLPEGITVNHLTVDSHQQMSSRKGTVVLQKATRPSTTVIYVEKCNQARNLFKKYVKPNDTLSTKIHINENLKKSERTC